MAPKDLKVLMLLIENPLGLYGSEFIHLSDGYLKRGTIYSTLQRLVDAGLVDETESPATSELNLVRTRHTINSKGIKAVKDYCDVMGLKRK